MACATCCLAKVACPSSPADFRPITVFGLLYRVWSSYHSRKALALLDVALPDTLHGGRPGRYAAQVWSKLLWTVEHSYQHSVDLSGVVADLQKAFNMLPRLAVFEIAGHLGLPGGMLVAWAGALSQMKRRFLLRGSLTAGVSSVTGFPEGCGLSCVAMVLIDFAFHVWQQSFFPLCTALSYVDDWQLLCPHSSMLAGAKRCLDLFVQAVDLSLDAKKTYAWSLTPEGRQLLRSEGFTVVLGAKNLGAHVQVSKKHTNASLMDRINSMASMWPRLRLSACGYRTKIRALLVAAWPRALHAVAATTLSDASIHSLRTGAMKGLEEDGAGCNAFVQLGLIEHPLVDPGFWTVIQTIRCARDCGDPEMIRHTLAALTQQPQLIPENCITRTLMDRLQLLGWHVNEDGLLHDVFGPFSLFKVCMAELILRAQWAWQYFFAAQVTHRPGFHNLHLADPMDTRTFLRSLSTEDQALFRKCLNGCHITQDGKAYCQEGGTNLCPYCNCTDSRFHRFWVCERFDSERRALSAEVHCLLATAPEFLTGYGWSLRPHAMVAWFQGLAAGSSPTALPVPCQVGDLHVFTDGSCMNQAFPTCRVAAWAVVLACPLCPGSSVVADSGPLPGILQSSYRAEIFAALRALQVSRLQTGKVFIWSDCNAVVKRFSRMLAGGEPKPNSAHYDLWLEIFLCLHEFSPEQIVVTKVKAHQLMVDVSSPLEEWCVAQNSLADQAANRAQWQRPASFWQLMDAHINATLACRRISREVQGVMLAISKAAICDAGVEEDAERVALGVPAEVPDDAWVDLQPLSIPAPAVRWYGDEVVRSVLSWYWQSLHDSEHDVIWVSQYHLCLDFEMSGERGPTKFDVWRPVRCTPHLDLLSILFQTRSRWFAKVLKECLRHMGQGFTFAYCRPHSDALFLHTGCLALRWDPSRICAIDNWILQFSPGGISRTSKALEGMPVASRNAKFPPVWLSCA